MYGIEAGPKRPPEEVWRQKLSDAEREYREAVRDLAGLQQSAGSVSDSDVHAATERRGATRQEYLRVLRIFTDLIVRGIRPKD